MRPALALAALLVVARAPSDALSLPQDQPPAPKAVQVVEVTAERFSFTPSEIRTVVGTTVQIRLRSDDTNHGFRIVGTDVNIEIPKRGRGVAMVAFTPDRAGKFTFECSHLCGAGHSFMRGEILVDDPAREAR